MEALLYVVLAASNILCFMIGARVGQTVSKGEKVELPTMNPLEVYRKNKADKDAKRVQDKFSTIMHNIDIYDGTGIGQKDVPGV